MKHCILESDWGNVHYWVSDFFDSKRRTLFFLHGLTASHKLFKHQIPYFVNDYNIIVWDAPLHGESRPFEAFTYEKAASLAKRILEDLGISKAVFIGQSMGGFITQSVLKRYPEIVEAFIAIDSTPFGDSYYSKFDQWMLKQVGWMSHFYSDKKLRESIARQVSTTDYCYVNMMDMLASYSKKELCHLMGIGYSGFLEDNCNLDITCPIMLIVGRKDITGKVIEYNEAWSKAIDVPITWIENAAHNANDDRPEEVNKAIAEFLQTLS